MRVILIGGKAGHGKDSFANAVKEKLNAAGKNVLIIHFADCLKFVASQFFGWDGQKDLPGRSLLQNIGNKMRDFSEHYWTDFVAELIASPLLSSTDYILIADWRHKEEYYRMLSFIPEEKISTVKIYRLDENGILYQNPNLTEQQKQHISEIDLDAFSVKTSIQAFTLEELNSKAATFAQNLLEEK